MHDEVGLFGYLDRVHELAERPTALDKLNKSIDCSGFEPVLKEHLNFKDRSKGGRKPLDRACPKFLRVSVCLASR